MALAVESFVVGAAQENCHVVRADPASPEAVVVDPGDDAEQLRLALERGGASCAAILVTHCHWDHVGAVAELAEWSGAPVYMSRLEAPVLEAPDDFYAPLGIEIRPYAANVRLAGDETFQAGGIDFETLTVPGHSPGHLAFHAEGCLFSGDVVFAGGVGRTDLPGSDWVTLLTSIAELLDRFPPDTVVYPGHGPTTTLGAELAGNPFLAELRAP